MRLQGSFQLLFSVYLLASTVLAAVTVERIVYETRRQVEPAREAPNPRFNSKNPVGPKNPKTITIPEKVTLFDIFGYRVIIPDVNPNDLNVMERLGVEAFASMEAVHRDFETRNRQAPEGTKRAPVAQPPSMMSVMRPGGPGTPLYIHSSLKGNVWGQGPLAIGGANAVHPAIRLALEECTEDMADITHKNEASCGEVMALNMWAKAKQPTAASIDLALVTGKLLVTVSKQSGVVRTMSPCSTTSRGGVETKPNNPKTWGCNKFTAQVGFLACEIGWSPGEQPTEEVFRGMRVTKRELRKRVEKKKIAAPKKITTRPKSTVPKTGKNTVPKTGTPRTGAPRTGAPNTTPKAPLGTCPIKRTSMGGLPRRGARSKKPAAKKQGTGIRS